jgi:hypothetical protein
MHKTNQNMFIGATRTIFAYHPKSNRNRNQTSRCGPKKSKQGGAVVCRGWYLVPETVSNRQHYHHDAFLLQFTIHTTIATSQEQRFNKDTVSSLMV